MPMPSLPTGPTPKAPAPPDAKALAGALKPGKLPDPEPAAAIVALPLPPFFYYHNPRCWDLSSTHGGENERLKEPTLLPALQKLLLVPGTNGCRTRKRGEPFEAVYVDAIFALKRKTPGIVFLNPSEPLPAWALPPGVPEGGYLREVEIENAETGTRATRWGEAWDLPDPVLPGMEQTFSFHRPTFELWLAYLVQSGTIQPAMPQIYAAKRRIWEDRIGNVQALSVMPEVKAQMLERRKPFLDAALGAKPVEDLPKVAGEEAA